MRNNPTVVLFCAMVALFFSALVGTSLLPRPNLIVLVPLAAFQGLALFVLYIVIHDAAHRTASKNRSLNELMLITCGVLFLFDPYLYRRLHLTHHAHTNEESDPDRFTASPYLVMRWARSFLIAGWYYAYCVRRFRANRTLLLHLCFTPLLLLSLSLVFAAVGRTEILVAGWFVPDFLAIGFLGFVLTAWPHHPATDTSRIGSARNLEVPRVLQLLLGYQHLHLVHHYAPTVPWHRLPVYWRANEERLSAKRAAIQGLEP